MKKIKLLAIFFFAIIIVIIIYKYTFVKTKNILFIGENVELNINEYKIIKYLYDNITYKELIKCIKNDEKITIKGKELSLNELIYSSNYIIINANNIEYNKKCYKRDINKYYENNIKKDKEKLIKLIKKISSAKVIILDNTCNNNDNMIDFT